MIVKNLDFRSLFFDKINEKLLSDELFSTLSQDKASQSFILQRICEISAAIILKEVEILLKNSNNQYNFLRKQYTEIEKTLKEVNNHEFINKIGFFY